MPDAQGNFKGISVSAEAWERIFARHRDEAALYARLADGAPVGLNPAARERRAEAVRYAVDVVEHGGPFVRRAKARAAPGR